MGVYPSAHSDIHRERTTGMGPVLFPTQIGGMERRTLTLALITHIKATTPRTPPSNPLYSTHISP